MNDNERKRRDSYVRLSDVGEGRERVFSRYVYLRNALYAHPIFHGIANICQLLRMTSQSLRREIIQPARINITEKSISVATELLTSNSIYLQ